MGKSTRTLQSADNRSLLLELYKELSLKNDYYTQLQIQQQIDQIVAQNFLHYVNR